MYLKVINRILELGQFKQAKEFIVSFDTYSILCEIVEKYYKFLQKFLTFNDSDKDCLIEKIQKELLLLVDLIPDDLDVLKRHIFLCVNELKAKTVDINLFDERFNRVVNDIFILEIYIDLYEKNVI